MSGDDVLGARLRRLAARLAEDETFELDEATVTRLLRGEVPAEDVSAPFAGVAEVLKAAAGPPQTAELDGEAEAIASFRATLQASARQPGRCPSNRRCLRVPVVAAAATALAIGAGGISAAAAGVLPDPVQKVAHAVLGNLGVPPPAPPAPAGPAPAPLPAASPPSASPSPDAGGPGQARPTDRPSPGGSASAGPTGARGVTGLCLKWELHAEGEGTDLTAEELDQLTAAAGGPDRVGATCEDIGNDQAGRNDKDGHDGEQLSPSAPPQQQPTNPPKPDRTKKPQPKLLDNAEAPEANVGVEQSAGGG
jgi:hypothetical protein